MPERQAAELRAPIKRAAHAHLTGGAAAVGRALSMAKVRAAVGSAPARPPAIGLCAGDLRVAPLTGTARVGAARGRRICADEPLARVGRFRSAATPEAAANEPRVGETSIAIRRSAGPAIAAVAVDLGLCLGQERRAGARVHVRKRRTPRPGATALEGRCDAVAVEGTAVVALLDAGERTREHGPPRTGDVVVHLAAGVRVRALRCKGVSGVPARVGRALLARAVGRIFGGRRRAAPDGQKQHRQKRAMSRASWLGSHGVAHSTAERPVPSHAPAPTSPVPRRDLGSPRRLREGRAHRASGGAAAFVRADADWTVTRLREDGRITRGREPRFGWVATAGWSEELMCAVHRCLEDMNDDGGQSTRRRRCPPSDSPARGASVIGETCFGHLGRG